MNRTATVCQSSFPFGGAAANTPPSNKKEPLTLGMQSNKRARREGNVRPLLGVAYECLRGKQGVIFDPSNGEFDFQASVQRIAEFMPKHLSATPVYEYELLTQAFKCNVAFKLENLQKFGDVYPRNYMSMLAAQYLNQRDAIQKEFSEIGGFVMILDPKENFSTLSMLPLVLVSQAVKGLALKPYIFVMQVPNHFAGNYSLLQCTQLFTCAKLGASLIFTKEDRATCDERARKLATEKHLIIIDPLLNRPLGILGAATVAAEILEQSPEMETIILPLRVYAVGWTVIYAIAFYLKIVKPTVRVVIVQMTAEERDPGFRETATIFPDLLENGWQSLSRDASNASTPRQIFDQFDYRNQGVFNKEDLLHALKTELGADVEEIVRFELTRPTFTLTEFIQQLHTEDQALTYSSAVGYLGLRNLYERGYITQARTAYHSSLIDEIVRVSEDEAAEAFLRTLTYTKTLTNGKGAAALAALFANKVQVGPTEHVVCLVSGGYIDAMDFQGIFEHAMGLMGQHFSVEVEIPDNATSLSKVLKVIAECGVSVRDVSMFREANAPMYYVKVIVTGYSRSWSQHTAIHEKLALMGFDCTLGISNHLGHHLQTVSLPQEQRKAAGVKSDLPMKVTTIEEVGPESIRSANYRIKKNILTTPLIHSSEYSRLCGCVVHLKLDNLQKTGSFKIRGSSNMVLKLLERGDLINGIITASAGNHAQGVSLVAKKSLLPCCVLCPEWAPDTKLSAVRQYGAELIRFGQSFEETTKEAERLAAERNWLLVRAFNDADVVEGQGTIGLEIFEEMPDVDTVIVNVGGGGMIAGIALYLKGVNPKIRIVGVQAESVAPLEKFKQTEELKYIDPSIVTIADGVNIKLPGGVHTGVLKDLVDEYVTVRENEIAATIVHLMEYTHTLSEGAGCLGLAALLYGKIKVQPNEKVCVVICGGNIDMGTLRQTYEYGLRALGRAFTIHLTMTDSPGSLAKVIAVAASFELKVQEVRHIRGVGDINWNDVTLSLRFYSNSFHHQMQFLNALVERKIFPQVTGREFIRNHEIIYGPFDKFVDAKRAEMSKEHQLKEKEFQARVKASTPKKDAK